MNMSGIGRETVGYRSGIGRKYCRSGLVRSLSSRGPGIGREKLRNRSGIGREYVRNRLGIVQELSCHK
jgi:hypothetical protein